MGTELLGSEFVLMKDTVWKLSSRVLLLEGFIKQQFGNVFWQFCEEQVGGTEDSPEEDDDELDDESTKPHAPIVQLPMPPMIPILSKKAPQHQSQQPPSSTLSTTRKVIPPPPPLSLMRGAIVSNHSTSSSYQTPKARNFLPKSLTASSNTATNSTKQANPSPKLPPSITITPTSGAGSGVHSIKGGSSGNNGMTSMAGVSILKEKITENLSSSNLSSVIGGGDENVNVNMMVGSNRVKLEAIKTLQQQQRKSPALINRHQTARLSSGSVNSSSSIPSYKIPQQQQQQLLQQHFHQEEYGGEFYPGESEESEEDSEMYGDGGYLAAELVSATLCPPEDGEECIGGSGSGSNKKIRLSLGGGSVASSSSFHNGSNGSGGSRQMRPNPCHARCQNRCHDIWTDGDRMGVFQTYWAVPNEEERREFVASRIERVDMATKRTEFSNFRTCTFKYYLPHPDNPWVQVCKNFFLATIDEKRSYIEKIAQSVKGDTGEKVSAKNIPFRRRNQMQRSVEENYAGWIQGLGLDSSMLDDPEGHGYIEGDQEQGDDTEDPDTMGVEIMDDEEEEVSQD